jgi:hypothetical protein
VKRAGTRSLLSRIRNGLANGLPSLWLRIYITGSSGPKMTAASQRSQRRSRVLITAPVTGWGTASRSQLGQRRVCSSSDAYRTTFPVLHPVLEKLGYSMIWSTA